MPREHLPSLWTSCQPLPGDSIQARDPAGSVCAHPVWDHCSEQPALRAAPTAVPCQRGDADVRLGSRSTNTGHVEGWTASSGQKNWGLLVVALSQDIPGEEADNERTCIGREHRASHTQSCDLLEVLIVFSENHRPSSQVPSSGTKVHL